MTSYQENFLNMIYTVKAVVDKFQTVWSKNTIFAAAYNLLNAIAPKIELNRDAQLASTKGVTTDKKIKKLELVDKAQFIINRIQSYATVIKNYELYENVNFSATRMKKNKRCRCYWHMRCCYCKSYG